MLSAATLTKEFKKSYNNSSYIYVYKTKFPIKFLVSKPSEEDVVRKVKTKIKKQMNKKQC